MAQLTFSEWLFPLIRHAASVMNRKGSHVKMIHLQLLELQCRAHTHTHIYPHTRAWSESKGWDKQGGGDSRTFWHLSLQHSRNHTEAKTDCLATFCINMVHKTTKALLLPQCAPRGPHSFRQRQPKQCGVTTSERWDFYLQIYQHYVSELEVIHALTGFTSSTSDAVLITQGDQKVHCTLIIWQTKHWQRRETDDGTMKENFLINHLQYKDLERNNRFSRASTVI